MSSSVEKPNSVSETSRRASGLSVGKPAFALGVLGLASVVATFIPGRLSAATDAYALCSSNGKNIYTVDYLNSQVECFTVNKGRIHATGTLTEIQFKWYTSNFVTNLLQGSLRYLPVYRIPNEAIIVPGISDSHAHILEFGGAQQLPLEGTKDVEDTVARVRNFVLANPDILKDRTRVITGGGWDHTVWPDKSLPSNQPLDDDPILRGRPIILQSKDCHALWVSSTALEPSFPLPDEVEGGIIVRDKHGNPTGVLLDNAQELLKQPELTEEDLLRRFKVTVREAHKHGLTSIHDAGLDPSSLNFFHRQAEIAPLPIRIYGMKFFNETQGYVAGSHPIVLPDKRLSVRSMKIFADGALRTGGAALYEPYADAPHTSGFMRIEPAVLYDVIPKFLENGWQVNVHAIGDKANGAILDVFESVLQGINVTALRPRLEHAQMITIEDVTRLAKLGVIASVQPTHAISDMWYAQDRLGPERVKRLYTFRSIIDAGARITLGSDFPVESINPLSGFYSAISRLSFEGTSPHGPNGWFPEERITREEALRGMTIDPAYASFSEHELGSIEVGKLADFTVLSADIMTIPMSKIMATSVLATAIDGEVVYGRI
ncbi:amidohydrolase [Coprinopsis sp. MPI-PUGE-AT-0042]|nr:amidohydrolase [Coprinopsis sp. MPI-PUGE-AT-0042]